jgi:hypothetical protein
MSIYCTLCVTRIALAKAIVSKTTHSSDMSSAQIAFTDSNQLGGDDLSGKVKLNLVPARTQRLQQPLKKNPLYETLALS